MKKIQPKTITEETSGRCTCDEYDWKPHICPFEAEIHDDFETKCTCCPWCEGECRDEV